jgi:hypothetical protein
METSTRIHRTLDLILFGGACFALIIVLLVRGGLYDRGPQAGGPAPAATTSAIHPIAEDDPGWNCHTMGNKSCGYPACAWLRIPGYPDAMTVYRICNTNVRAGASWVRFHDVDGHHGCRILVGDTSLMRCGKWVTTS